MSPTDTYEFLTDIAVSALGALIGLMVYFGLLKGHWLWKD